MRVFHRRSWWFAALVMGVALSPGGCDCDGSDGAGAGGGTEGGSGGGGATATGGAGGAGGAVDPALAWSWDFEEGEPGTAVPTAAGAVVDASGNGLDATASEGLRFVSGHLAGSTAIAFGGDAEGVSIDADRLNGAADVAKDESFRLEVGFRTDVHGQDGDAGAGVLVTHGLENGAGYRLSVVDGSLVFELSAGADVARARIEAPVADGRWHRALAVRDVEAGEIAISVDGQYVARAPDVTAGESIAPSAPVRVGSREGGAGFLGEIDVVRFARAAAVLPTASWERDVSTIFEANTDLVPGGGGTKYATARIPSIVRAPDGSLLAFAEGRVKDQCDFGDIDIVMKRSDDHGKTWSPIERVADFTWSKVGNPIPIVDEETGRIVLLTTREALDAATCNPPASGCGCEPLPDSRRVHVQTSDDSGVTWTDPKDIHESVLDPMWSSILVGPAHGIQLRHGPRAGALVAVARHRGSDGLPGGHVMMSEDSGETWSVADGATSDEVNVNESTVAELADGRLYFNTRHHLGADDVTPAERLAGLRGEAYLDDAVTFVGNPVFSRAPRFRGPVVEGSLLRWEGSSRFGDHPRVLFAYPAGEHGSSAGQRHDLRVYASHDETSTWARGRRVLGAWAAYTDLVDIGDGRVGLMHEAGSYYDAGANLGRFYQRVDFLRFGVEWLDDDTLAGWSFEPLAPGASFGEPVSSGGFGVALQPVGDVTLAPGRHHSAAAHFDGASRACAADSSGLFDFGSRDSFAIDIVFRTDAHQSGDAEGSGTLIGRTRVGTEPAWWIRVENGKVRFHVAACAGADSNCGVLPDSGLCDSLGTCENTSLLSNASVGPGIWHRVVVSRDAKAGLLLMDLDGDVVETPFTSNGILKNDLDVCLGAFGDGARAFEGDIDFVRMSLTD
ncbi:MAG: hypothetical protein HOW73_45490 [Polyangiaceae bacterium]|nr:hypothetical protein [Polyangiaceae bacterium]